MKNIRSKSIAALSLMLLLSTTAVRSMEDIAGVQPFAIDSNVQAAPAEVVKSSYVAGAINMFNSVTSKAVSSWASRPSLAVMKDAVSNQASDLYESAKAHPYIAAGAAVGATVAAVGTYKLGQRAVRAVKNRKATAAPVAQVDPKVQQPAVAQPAQAVAQQAPKKSEQQVIAEIKTKGKQVLDSVRTIANAFAIVKGPKNLTDADKELIRNELALLINVTKELPASEISPKAGAIKDAVRVLVRAVTNWAASDDRSLQAILDANNALKAAVVNPAYEPTLTQRVASYLPSANAVKTAAIVGGAVASVAVPATLVAYNNGSLNSAVSSIANGASTVYNTAKNGVAAGAEYVNHHRTATGVTTAAVAGAAGTTYAYRTKANNAVTQLNSNVKAAAQKVAPYLPSANAVKTAAIVGGAVASVAVPATLVAYNNGSLNSAASSIANGASMVYNTAKNGVATGAAYVNNHRTATAVATGLTVTAGVGGVYAYKTLAQRKAANAQDRAQLKATFDAATKKA